ncbi:hypothetical protein ACQPXS_35585 [Streptomyces sp. CA-142005]|uniref:hypothetical protein n=1 Tax=Streptomyces sp. CA-142005 TaxID=3240052 RepID=UPI003D90DE7A
MTGAHADRVRLRAAHMNLRGYVRRSGEVLLAALPAGSRTGQHIHSAQCAVVLSGR